MSQVLARTILIAILVTAVPVAVPAQEEPVEEVFAEELEVTEVLLDVLVTDKHDRIILGLGADDFVVSEESEVLELTSVTFYRVNRSGLDRDYLYYCFLTDPWQAEMRAVMEQTTRNQVSIQKQAKFRLPLAPLEDQRKIAVLLDGFMALCDQLEAHVQRQEATSTKLAAAAVRALASRPTETPSP